MQDPYTSEMTPDQKFMNEEADKPPNDIPQLSYATNGISPATGDEEGLLATAGKYLKEGRENVMATEEMV